MAVHDRTTLSTAATQSTAATLSTAVTLSTALTQGAGTAGGPQILGTDPDGQVRCWALLTTLTAWCQTCGTEVEFAAPTGAAPADLAAEERGCVWCGEALVVSCTPVLDSTASAA